MSSLKFSEALEASNSSSSVDKIKNLYAEVLRVAVVEIPGLLFKDTQGEWSGPIFTILRQVVARLPGIHKIKPIEAESIEDANTLLLSGQVTLNAAPQPISLLLLSQFAGLAISKTQLSPSIVWPVTAAADVPCVSGTLSYALSNAGESDILQALLDYYAGDYETTHIFVNTPQQRDVLTEAGIPLGVIIVINAFFNNAAELSAFLRKAAVETDTKVCNVAFIGDLGACFQSAALTAVSLELATFPESEATGTSLGWALPKYAPKLQFSLQFALDYWLKSVADNNTVDHLSKKKDCKDGCAYVPYPVVQCLLFPPPPRYSLCRRYIPDYAVHELSLRTEQKVCHPVQVIGEAECEEQFY